MTDLLVMGAGLIGERHIRQVQQHPDCRLAGIIETDHSRCGAFDAPIYSAIADVKDDVDGVIIATPTGLHAEHVEQAAARGWDILIEKPIAGTLEDAARIVEAVQKHKVSTLVGHHRRQHASIHQLRKIINLGKIGNPVIASLFWALKKPDEYFQGNWREGSAGSPVMINLVHDVDLLRFLFGEVVSVRGLGSAMTRKQERVESGVVALGFEGGIIASICFADTAVSPWAFEAGTGENPNIATTSQDMLWIAGTKGGVSFPSLTLWSGAKDWSQAPTSTPARDWQARPDKRPDKSPLKDQLDHFIAIIRKEAKPVIDAVNARETLAVALQIEAEVSNFNWLDGAV